MNSEWIIIWKEAIVNCFVLLRYSPVFNGTMCFVNTEHSIPKSLGRVGERKHTQSRIWT